MSRYRLSKASGIPWTIIADIYYGKKDLSQCGVEIYSKLSSTLEISIDELLKVTTVQEDKIANENIVHKTYLEVGLPESIQKAIVEYLQGEKEQVLYLDCLWGELYGAINSNL